ncbi:hypothetical protein J4234_02880 [Candidatus Woesearchaeota archaeon]|nr:hypothetical protein [Candidatus Woesearchaeota archaeon]
MPKKLLVIFFIISVFVLGCSSDEGITGKTAAAEPSIYEDDPATEQQAENQTQSEDQTTEEATGENITDVQEIQIKTGEEYYDELVNDKPKESINPEEFKFSPESIVSTQNNISLSLDGIRHEIKNEYWGKIIELTSTVLNKEHGAFKPKLLVLLYDEKDFREDWLKPKAEIGFDIAQLNPGEHATRQAIVSISFDDLSLTKHFKLILVDAADIGNKPLVVVEKEFNPVLG